MTESRGNPAKPQRPITVDGHALSAKAAQRVMASRERAMDRLQSECEKNRMLILDGQFVSVDMVEARAKSIRRKCRWMLLDIAFLYVGLLGLAAFGLLVLSVLARLGK